MQKSSMFTVWHEGWEERKKEVCPTLKRKKALTQSTPSWLNVAHHVEIDEMYLYNKIMPGDWHVDHIVPIQGDTVRGLHVPWNLQVLPAKENLSKNNYLLEEAA